MVTAAPAAVELALSQAQGGCLMCRQVLVEDVVSTGTIGGQSRASRGDSRGESRGDQAGSTIDCIVHLRPLQQALGGGQLASSAPAWLSGVGRFVRTWLQHWLKPRHLKGEDSRLPSLLREVACRLAAPRAAVRIVHTYAVMVTAALAEPRHL